MNIQEKKIMEMTFGALLALAINNKAYIICKDNLSPADQKTIEALYKRIHIGHERQKPVLKKLDLPKESCPVGESYLIKNKDLLLELFTGHNDTMCGKLIEHMNQCMSCFEFFGETLRDYYRVPQVIMNKKGQNDHEYQSIS
jgi:hypothetical protein